MLILIHNNNKVIEILDENLKVINGINYNKSNVSEALITISEKYSEALVIWCHQELKSCLKLDELTNIFHHKHILATFNTSKLYLSNKIDYLERSICLNFNKNKTYGTYLMSSQVGGMFTETILKFKNQFNFKKNLDYNLNSIAKLYQIEGLFCYSEPKLLEHKCNSVETKQISNIDLYCFVKEHYKWIWVWFLLFCNIFYEKRIYIIPFMYSIFCKQKNIDKTLLSKGVKSSKTEITSVKTIDVVIPTIGRKEHLLNVLKDLKQQTILPKQVIIIEQNGDEKAKSELDYLQNQDWPFQITHKFIHVLGVCNARNEALKELNNSWVFFADDDIRFHNTMFQETFDILQKYGTLALNYSCLQPHQKQSYFNIGQTFIFGSGSSFVSSKIAKQLKFNKGFEFGFGEDTDYGAQIRQLGYDIVFAANINLKHLKAPIGGFRQSIPKLWDNETIKPKPSPTMMLLSKMHFTTNQLKGYKLFLFLKLYAKKNPIKHIIHKNEFIKSWNKSVFYANKLRNTLDA